MNNIYCKLFRTLPNWIIDDQRKSNQRQTICVKRKKGKDLSALNTATIRNQGLLDYINRLNERLIKTSKVSNISEKGTSKTRENFNIRREKWEEN